MEVLVVKFSDDKDYIMMGMNNEYRIYSLTSNSNIELKISKKTIGGIAQMAMHKSTNLMSYVGGGDNPINPLGTVIVYDIRQDTSLKELNFEKYIKNILFDHNQRIHVVSEDQICVVALQNPNKSRIRTTYQNPNGLIKITNISEDNSDIFKTVVVTLGKEKGDIFIWRLDEKNDNAGYSGQEDFHIKAHVANITALAISKDGTLVATASEVGSLIRVFDTSTGEQLYEFRRGTSMVNGGGVYDLAISRDNRTLVCCSTNGTVHIFDMYENEEDSINVKSVGAYLGSYVSNYYDSQWAFHKHYLETTDKMICGFDKDDVLHVITYGGKHCKIYSGIDSEPENTEIHRYNCIKHDNLYINA